MSAVEVRVKKQRWESPVPASIGSAATISSARRWLQPAAGACVTTLDIVLVSLAFLVAYWMRFWTDDSLPALGIDKYLRLAVMQGFLTTALLGAHGLHDLERPRSWPVRFRGIVSAVSTALVLVLTASYFMGDQSFSRLWLATGWGLSILGLVVSRTLAQRIYALAREAFGPANRVLIVGANRLGRRLADDLKGLNVVGYVDNGSDLNNLDLPLLGPISQLEQLVHAYAVDELIIALPANRRGQISRLLAKGFSRYVRVNLLPDLDGLARERFQVQQLGGVRFVGFVPVAAVSWLKRAVDLLLVGAGMIAIAPLLVMVGIAIKLDSPGPVFYEQQRVGKNGRPFKMLKFRSMFVGADRQLEALRLKNEASGPLFKIRQDPRVTRVGRWLRRWSIDELPQLINVLRGEMSLVGPRPPLPSEVEQYEDWQFGRLRAVPGLTGLWQVSGRSEVPFHDMVRLDLHYIRNWSLALDIEILLRTIPAVLTSRGAY